MRLQAALRSLSNAATVVVPTQAIDAVTEDPDDNRVLECAVAAGSRYVVTGDNHLLRLSRCAGIPIVRVSDFMQRSAI